MRLSRRASRYSLFRGDRQDSPLDAGLYIPRPQRALALPSPNTHAFPYAEFLFDTRAVKFEALLIEGFRSAHYGRHSVAAGVNTLLKEAARLLADAKRDFDIRAVY